MSNTRKRISTEDFQKTLSMLRRRINTVPEEHRAILWAAADHAQKQRDRMRIISAQIEDTVADIGLIVEHTHFHLAACRREFLQRNPEAHIPF